MNTIELNKKGQEFIFLRTKQVKQTMYFFPFFLLISIGVGILKLGFEGILIIAILLTFPVFFIGLYNAAIRPKRILDHLIVRIELEDEKMILHSPTSSFKTKYLKQRKNLHIFNVVFLAYYTETYNKRDYYLIPEFFDDFDMFEKRLLSKE